MITEEITVGDVYKSNRNHFEVTIISIVGNTIIAEVTKVADIGFNPHQLGFRTKHFTLRSHSSRWDLVSKNFMEGVYNL